MSIVTVSRKTVSAAVHISNRSRFDPQHFQQEDPVFFVLSDEGPRDFNILSIRRSSVLVKSRLLSAGRSVVPPIPLGGPPKHTIFDEVNARAQPPWKTTPAGVQTLLHLQYPKDYCQAVAQTHATDPDTQSEAPLQSLWLDRMSKPQSHITKANGWATPASSSGHHGCHNPWSVNRVLVEVEPCLPRTLFVS